ncbi:MAG: DUF2071 domain-containing protein [Chloroflexi bacterium]|nr:DUF2071 domain-containing protein [Chloroflexota bacterium]
MTDLSKPPSLRERPLPPQSLLAHTTHRPFPPPRGPWLMAQSWGDLLFAHWPVSPEALRPLLPPALPLDTFNGQAWIGVIPFAMDYIRGRGLPPIPLTRASLELNVRTYVIRDGKPGVWFFSLDANNPLVVLGARLGFKLPYFNARMRLAREDDTVHYWSRRQHPGAVSAEFRVAYEPSSAVFLAQPDTLEHWLTERYILYTAGQHGTIYGGEIHHIQWPLQRAEADIRLNTMAAAVGIELPQRRPLLHYARRMDMLVWPLEVVGK